MNYRSVWILSTQGCILVPIGQSESETKRKKRMREKNEDRRRDEATGNEMRGGG